VAVVAVRGVDVGAVVIDRDFDQAELLGDGGMLIVAIGRKGEGLRGSDAGEE
jgi:hypothetical protein